MKKDQINKISGGLTGLLNPTPQAPVTADGETSTERKKKGYKAVCYNISPELIEKIKDIAYWDRKRVNVVVTEAFERYITEWDKHGKPNN